MTDRFSFSIQFKKTPNKSITKFNYMCGLHIIYGESNVGKSELIHELANLDGKETTNFKIIEINKKSGIKIVLQNPDLQIVSNSLENELAFNLECNSNNTEYIKQQLVELKNKFLISADFDRHPVSLSGGEKEILNITTTFSLPSNVILIDDALSFLSVETKGRIINQLLLNKSKDVTILWFTSDENDLLYGTTKWRMTSTEIVEIDTTQLKVLPKIKLPKGDANIVIDNLNFSYDDKNQIFSNYSKSIKYFRCLGITGNNGSGKSTLASLLLNIEKPQSGSIIINIGNKSEIKIGYLDQFPEKLLGIMTLSEFVTLLINDGRLLCSNKIEIIDLLKSHNIKWDEVKNTLGIDLSWTMLRFALIIVLSNCDYDLLILDEPTFGMGTQQKVNLQLYFDRYLKEKHLILISHDDIFINSLCDATIKL